MEMQTKTVWHLYRSLALKASYFPPSRKYSVLDSTSTVLLCSFSKSWNVDFKQITVDNDHNGLFAEGARDKNSAQIKER